MTCELDGEQKKQAFKHPSNGREKSPSWEWLIRQRRSNTTQEGKIQVRILAIGIPAVM